MTPFPPISAESGFIAALLIGFLLFIMGHEIIGSLCIIGAVAFNYIFVLSIK
jgi:hypothetical protein